MTEQFPRVGVAAWIIHDGKVLMNYRTKPHGGGTWAPPGGHLEMNESWEDCARREAMEEAGLHIEDVEFFALTNDIFPESGKHYITIHMQSRSKTANFINREPEKYKDYQWFKWDELPSPLFPSNVNLLKQNKKPPYLS
ncbi:MAG: NUDIX domain-containing protein [Proteobacteria bacterium]|nr:NUDIX domain-containing protein [Pseudomonadota bacterium]